VRRTGLKTRVALSEIISRLHKLADDAGRHL
jgi:hypothetical protein